ncbi:putative sulfate exporter family transporter [Brachybacterium huguangmaarense]
MSAVRRLGPGLAVSFAVALGAWLLSRAVPAASTALVAILLGALAANLGLLPAVLRPGLDLAAKRVLRIGIVLLGLQLALGDVVALGPGAIALILGVVALGMVAGLAAGRALRLPFATTVLVTSGFSICGAAAVAAVRGSLAPETGPGESEDAARERLETQTATAVALVVVFGTLMIPLVPLAAGALGLSARGGGLWAGASIHEVAQVVAAGGILGPDALAVAILVKLGRVLLLAPVIALVTVLARRRTAALAGAVPGEEPSGRSARPPLVPLFVLAFLGAVVLRTLGVVPEPVLEAARPIQALCLAAAMFALGTGVRVALLRQVGGRPVVLAAIVTAVVAAVGLAGALVLS